MATTLGKVHQISEASPASEFCQPREGHKSFRVFTNCGVFTDYGVFFRHGEGVCLIWEGVALCGRGMSPAKGDCWRVGGSLIAHWDSHLVGVVFARVAFFSVFSRQPTQQRKAAKRLKFVQRNHEFWNRHEMKESKESNRRAGNKG